MSVQIPFKKTLYLNGVIVGEVQATGDVQEDIEAMRQFLKDKGLYTQVSKVQAAFRQALSFATTAAHLHERDLSKLPRNGLSVAPFVVNSAFSIELYLKTLYELEGVSKRGHFLLELYDGLADATRAEVERQAIAHAKDCGVILTTSDQFRPFVSDLNNAYISWRYCFETGSADQVSIQATIVVMKSLHEACRELGAT